MVLVGRLLVLLAAAATASGFATLKGASRVSVSSRCSLASPRALVLASEPEPKPEPEFFYETDSDPPKQAPKPPVSKSMRDKLMKENRAFGGDPDTAGGNPILLVSVVIAVLAILVIGGGMA
mmetsp:Transcript_37767/g.88712  ORF Transcript_37767/g.88712 Transcript_37767/m.88712 type:complete len:122 (-) Transcript_37767:478-843(-)